MLSWTTRISIDCRHMFAEASDKTKLYTANKYIKNDCSKHKTVNENANVKVECDKRESEGGILVRQIMVAASTKPKMKIINNKSQATTI